jgi:hypothetical protein
MEGKRMRREAVTGRQAGLARARREFERWRRRRQRGERIPESLWQIAVGVARAQGVSQASLALHLDYYDLQRRVAASTPVASSQAAPTFLELSLPASRGQARCQLELSEVGGGQVRVEVSGLSPRELATFVRAVASQEADV